MKILAFTMVCSLAAAALLAQHGAATTELHEEVVLRWASGDGDMAIEVTCRTADACVASREAIRQAFPSVHPVEHRSILPMHLLGAL